MELQQALIAGGFGVAVAIITWLLAGLREIGINKRESKKQKQEKLESLYAKTISLLEMVFRVTMSKADKTELEENLSNNNGMLILLASDKVNKQFQITSELIQNWSSLYIKGSPKNVTGSVQVSTCQDSKNMEKANEAYTEVQESINNLIDVMKEHIVEMENA